MTACRMRAPYTIYKLYQTCDIDTDQVIYKPTKLIVTLFAYFVIEKRVIVFDWRLLLLF